MKVTFSDVIIIGAGAAGLFCAGKLAERGKQVTILDNGKKIGRKILMSGGGFCNFTNLDITPQHYLSNNPHFVKSALARFTQWDFIDIIAKHSIPYHEKELGQLFCDNGAADIVNLLHAKCQKHAVNIQYQQQIAHIEYINDSEKPYFKIHSNGQDTFCHSLVIASGGLSMPALGASPFGYQIAEQFGINVIQPRAGLVPFTYREADKFLNALSGISLPVHITAKNGKSFSNNLLFTHRGLSGPAILQISNYWQANESIEINLLPTHNITEYLQQVRTYTIKSQLKTALTRVLPKKLIELWQERNLIQDVSLANLTKAQSKNLETLIHHWQFQPNGTEGYRTAEVTIGGVDSNEISSKTMESHKIKGLYFIGEVLDVAGQLGGYNFQWAWSSAYACAQAIP